MFLLCLTRHTDRQDFYRMMLIDRLLSYMEAKK